MVSLWFAFAVNVALTAIGGGAIRVPGLLTNKEVSEKYTTLMTPSGWAFAIWSYIFFFESVVVAAQTFGAVGGDAVVKASLAGAVPYLSSAFMTQGVWALAFGLEWLWASSLIIFGIFVSLVMAVRELGVGGPAGSAGDPNSGALLWDAVPLYYVGVIPVCVHMSWVAMATVLNINCAAVRAMQHVPGRWQRMLAFCSQAVAVVAATGLTVAFGEPACAAVGFWALFAISSKNKDMKEGASSSTSSASSIRLRRAARGRSSAPSSTAAPSATASKQAALAYAQLNERARRDLNADDFATLSNAARAEAGLLLAVALAVRLVAMAKD